MNVVCHDSDGRIIVNPRAWSAVWRAGDPLLPAVGSPGVENFCLAEAYMGAPVCWSVVAQSNKQVSNLALRLELMGVAGTVATVQGQVSMPYFQSTAIPGMGVRVTLGLAAFQPGEELLVSIAPLVWPEWCRPEVVHRKKAVVK